ncbi:MAG: carotenoid biosynthesis protein [Ignavibacteriales bacterium]|jgi:Protein of unknown function (DUF422).|nr:MAG: carotenoid biosynthesis protein [Ignavibacteriaceae bacterium]MBW7872675.1 carotenoid biosynthesis protein [Ignavibacteria bacterium]MCZ2143396.1 carotenoid biosynthesis protein [Ignavibacteriales bacterium]OQY74092.1 MAG: hypothetical protein B6D45_07325 [Ignavibacteriales bacterium UTCHB3]MBV6444275.1 hypothetical protein [Ignavibacteriaceae bacterium]
MEKEKFTKTYLPVLILALFFALGVLGHSLDNFLNVAETLTPWGILLSVIYVIFVSREDWDKKVIIWAVGVIILFFVLRIVNHEIGAIFGTYTTGNLLGPALFGVPLVMIINRAMIVYGIVAILTEATENIFAFSFLAGVALVAFDFTLQPVAAKLAYWQWAEGKVPFQNYISWFIIGAVVSVPYYLLRKKPVSRVPIWLVLIEVVFFLLLGLVVN